MNATVWMIGSSPIASSRTIAVPEFVVTDMARSMTVQRLPTEPVGSHALTLTNVVVGSRVAIRDQANTTTLYDQIAAASTVTIPLPVYSLGSPLNDWRIKIRKATDTPYYRPYETLTTVAVGSSSIYVSQLPD